MLSDTGLIHRFFWIVSEQRGYEGGIQNAMPLNYNLIEFDSNAGDAKKFAIMR